MGRKKNSLKIETDCTLSDIEVWGSETHISGKINLYTAPFHSEIPGEARRKERNFKAPAGASVL